MHTKNSHGSDRKTIKVSLETRHSLAPEWSLQSLSALHNPWQAFSTIVEANLSVPLHSISDMVLIVSGNRHVRVDPRKSWWLAGVLTARPKHWHLVAEPFMAPTDPNVDLPDCRQMIAILFSISCDA
jgi:hypothetical protein